MAVTKMKLQSLGYQSELIFTDFDGQVDDRGDYVVIRTLTNPNYFWGNLLVFDRAPTRTDLAGWVATFKKEFPDPRIYHVTLAWDAGARSAREVGDASAFIEAGYDFETKAVLSTMSVRKPLHFNDKLVVRPLATPGEWEALVALEVRSAHDNMPPAEWERFYRSQNKRYQAMSKAGLGNWYGGFLDGKLVTTLGIFHRAGNSDANAIGRFQSVGTDPDFRRQGLCGTLVYLAAEHAFKTSPIKTLVMCADPDYHAIKIYESVGFKRTSTEYGVYWWDRSHRA